MTVLVTGAAGFVGYHVARALCARGEAVRALVRPGSPRDRLDALPVECVGGDLCNPASLRHALRGCTSLYHVAAAYTFSLRNRAELYASNVDGTRNVLQAAMDAGTARVVYTSTVGALATSHDGTVADEETPVTLPAIVGHYKRSKYLAQQVALDFAARGLPVVIVNPTAPVGPGDVKPTPTGRLIVDFLCGRLPAYVETGLNLVPVEDVAAGHLLAADKGHGGQMYILGARNLPLREILEILARLSGRQAPRWRIPHWVAMTYAAGCEVGSWFTRRPPGVSLESTKVAAHFMYYDASKATRELGFRPGSVDEALDRAVRWFRANGHAP